MARYGSWEFILVEINEVGSFQNLIKAMIL